MIRRFFKWLAKNATNINVNYGSSTVIKINNDQVTVIKNGKKIKLTPAEEKRYKKEADKAMKQGMKALDDSMEMMDKMFKNIFK